MEYKIADHINIRASLAVLVIDDYTNKVIRDTSIQISAEGASKPIRKSEGYYIFLNLIQTKVELTVKSSNYATERRSIDLEALDKTDPVVKIRVKPSKNYSLLKGTTSLIGYAEPFSEIRVSCSNIQKYFRLLYDYESGVNKEEIHIYNPEKTDLDGKILLITNDKTEIFYILNTKDRENNLYKLEKPLEHNYKKVGTKIFPVFVTKADETGEYFIPLWNLGEEAADCQCEMLGSSKLDRNISLEIGKMNRLNFI